MYTSECGRYRICTTLSLLEVRPQHPKEEWMKARSRIDGPLYHIIYSSVKEEEAEEERKRLVEKYKGKVRIHMIPAKDELTAIAAGRGIIIPIEEEEGEK